MIERFDVSHKSKNRTYNIFSQEHVRRYLLAREFILNSGERHPKILDAASGCGYGYTYLGDLGDYLGLDVEIDAARREYGNHYAYCDFDSRGLTAYQANVIVSLETAEHLRDPDEFLAQAFAILSPIKGYLVFSAPTSLTMDFDPYHLRDWNATRWRIALERAGFIVCKTVSMPFTTSFFEFLGTTPTTWHQKGKIGKFLLFHPRYLLSRLWNWALRNRFFWESTLFFCSAGREA